MSLNLSFTNLIHFISIIIGFATGLVLMYFSLLKNRSNLPLSLYFLSVSMAIFISLLVFSGLMVHMPIFYRTGNIFGLMLVPLPYLYMRCITEKRVLTGKDLLHFIPMVIYIIDFSPILLLSLEEKRDLVQSQINDPNLFVQYTQSMFFPDGFHQAFRVFLINIYWVFQISHLLIWRKKLSGLLSQAQKEWQIWIITLMVLQFFLFLPFYLTFLWVDKSMTYELVHTSGAILLLVSAGLLYYYPSLLYGFQEEGPDSIPSAAKDLSAETNKQVRQIDKKQEELGKFILGFIDDRKVYLIPNYTIHDLAKDTQTPTYQISSFINHSLESHFVDLINKKRIEYCVKMLESGHFNNLTLEGVSAECGFNNRNSFTGAFKKYQGVNPSKFRKLIENRIDLV